MFAFFKRSTVSRKVVKITTLSESNFTDSPPLRLSYFTRTQTTLRNIENGYFFIFFNSPCNVH